MKKPANLLLLCLLALSLAACGSSVLGGNPEADTVFAAAEADYDGDALEANSPEGLAQASARAYMGMINGDISPDEGFDIVLGLAPPEQAEALEAQRSEFTSQISTTKDMFAADDNGIEGYVFSKTYMDDDNQALASIYRVQNMKDGNMYFFRQDFVKAEDGNWYIRGDNVVNDFAIEKE